MVCNNEEPIQAKEKKEISGELEEEKVSLNILPVDVYNDPQLEESLAELTLEPLDNDNASDKTKDENIDETTKVVKKSPNLKKKNEKKLMPSDVYADPEDIKSPKFISNSEIAKIVSDESRKIMPAPRVYNGVLPSSSYPGFSKSRVNLIN